MALKGEEIVGKEVIVKDRRISWKLWLVVAGVYGGLDAE